MLKFRLLLAQCNPSPQQHLFGAYAEIQIIFGTCVTLLLSNNCSVHELKFRLLLGQCNLYPQHYFTILFRLLLGQCNP